MTTDAPATSINTSPGGWRPATANLLSEALAPWVCAGVLPPVVGALTGHPWWKGALLGVLTAAFSAGIPYLLILRGVRRGTLTDRHVSRRSDRPVLLGITVALVVVGLVRVHLLGGPQQLAALIVAMIACAVVGMVVSVWWKLSMHAVVLAGSVAVLVVVLGPWALLLAVLVVPLAWARVFLGSHTPAQVGVGAVVGAVVAGLIMVTV
jgi:hypothetical protein